MTVSKVDVAAVITLGAWLTSCAFAFRYFKDRVRSERFWREHCAFWRDECKKDEEGRKYWSERVAVLVERAKKQEESLKYWSERVAVLVERAKKQEECNAWLEQQLCEEQKRTAHLLTKCAVMKRQAMSQASGALDCEHGDVRATS